LKSDTPHHLRRVADKRIWRNPFQAWVSVLRLAGNRLGMRVSRLIASIGWKAVDKTASSPDAPSVKRPSGRASRQGVLVATGLYKSFQGKHIIRGVSIGVRRGEAVGLLGPNGAGKTTCFYMITGLIRVDAGRIELDGHDITSTPMYRRARLGIGYLPQEASIFRGLNVEDNIRAVLEVAERDAQKREYRLDALLEEFSISHLRKTPSIALSGGERRRCEIARALATRPSFILLDEPFAGIDPIAVGDIQELVRHLTRRGIGVLITDHNVRETLGLIDRAYIIAAGRVLTHGRPEEIVRNPDVRRTYLGEQFTL
jgi:lipopolysaccharide export system ATP-binding protein